MTLVRNEASRAGPDEALGSTTPLVRYAEDIFTWAYQQSALLRAGRWSDLDIEKLAEEISDVGRGEYHRLQSALTRLIQHLIKWDYQPERRGASWAITVREQRRHVARLLHRNPGLKSALGEALDAAYEDGRDEALRETGLPERRVPSLDPYTWDDIMAREIVWPED